MEIDADLHPVGVSILHIVANTEDAKTLTLLLESDRSLINNKDRHSRTPLSVALQNGRLSAAKILIEYGADLNVPYFNGPKDSKPSTALEALSSNPAFHELVVNLVECLVPLPFSLSSLLTMAASEGKEEMLRKLLASYQVDINGRDYLQRTALHYACQKGNFAMTSTLLQFGANRIEKDWQGSTPLHLACMKGHIDVAHALLENAEPGEQAEVLCIADTTGNTPIHIALLNNQIKLFASLVGLYRHQLNLTLVNRDGYTIPTLLFTIRFKLSSIPMDHHHLFLCLSNEEATLLLYEGVYCENPRLMEFAIENGGTVNLFDFMQQSPLLLAAKLGCVEACRILAAHGANINAADSGGKTALQYASELQHIDIVSFLLSLPDINPSLMFSRYSYLLSSELIRVFVAYFQRAPARPLNWRKWLTLAAPIASGEAFSSLVECICPEDWVARLLGKDSDHCQVSPSKIEKSPLGIAYRANTTMPYLKLETNTIQSPRKVKPFAALSNPPSHCWNFKVPGLPKKIPKSVVKRLSRKQLFASKPKINSKDFSHFPLHEAVLHGNREVVEFIMSSAIEPHFQAELLVNLVDSQGRTVLELAGRHPLMLAALEERQLPDLHGHTGNEFSVPTLTRKLFNEKFPLPDRMTFEEALIHYLLVGDQKDLHHSHDGHFYFTHPLWAPCETPLLKWPLWYFLRELTTFCSNQGSDLLSLSSQEEREKLMTLALDQLGEAPSDYLLYTAVSHGCTWGVELLLQYGASPAACHKERYAIATAVMKSECEIIDLLLKEGSAPFLGLPELSTFFSSLVQGLTSLANNRHWEYVSKVLETFPLAEHFWLAVYSPRLVYVVSTGNAELADSLASEFVSFLCDATVRWKELTEDDQQEVCNSLKKFQQYSSLFQSVHSSLLLHSFAELISFVNRLMKYKSLQLLFHGICGHGYNRQVALMLQCASSSTQLVNSLDERGRSPLYYAACGGHLEVAELLLSEAHDVSYSGTQSPIQGLLIYLTLTVYKHDSTSEFQSMNEKFQVNVNLRYKLIQHLQSIVPLHCCLSQIYKTPALYQLMELLVPPSSGGWAEGFLRPIASDSESVFIHPLWLVASVSKLKAMETVLQSLSEYISGRGGCSYGGVCFSFTGSDITTDKPHSHGWLDVAIVLSPKNLTTSTSQYLDKILTWCCEHQSDHSPSSLASCHCGVSAAAKRGLWGLVCASLSTDSFAAESESNYKWCEVIVSEVARKGKSDVVAAVLRHASKSFLSCLNFNKPMCTAVRYDNIAVVKVLLGHNCCNDLLPAVRSSIIHGRKGIFKHFMSSKHRNEIFTMSSIENLIFLAVKYCRLRILDCLQSIYNDPDLAIACDFPSRHHSFQFLVLLEAAKSGHQKIGLEAIASFSENELASEVQTHKYYLHILYWCCFWGMTALLQCIPFTEEQLLTRVGEFGDVSPWECGVATGNMGTLSLLPNFPPIPQDVDVFLKNSIFAVVGLYRRTDCHSHKLHQRIIRFIDALSIGWFHKMCSNESNTEPAKTHSQSVALYGAKSYISTSVFLKALGHNHVHIVDAFLNIWGENAAKVLQLLATCFESSFPAFLGSRIDFKNGKDVLERILEVVFKAGISSDNFLFGSYPHSLFFVAIKDTNCSIECLDVILHYYSPNSSKSILDSEGKKCILHAAAQNGDPQIVKAVISVIGSDVPDLCFLPNDHRDYPLYLAYATGHYRAAALLREEAKKSLTFSSDLPPDWRAEAWRVRGWFRELMERNALCDPGTKMDISSQYFSLRNISLRRVPILDIMVAAVKHNNTGVVDALLATTYPLAVFSERTTLDNILPNIQVLRLVFSSGYAQEVLGGYNATPVACTAVTKHKHATVIELLECSLAHGLPIAFGQSAVQSHDSSQLVINLSKVFTVACLYNCLELVEYLVNSTEYQIRSSMTEGILSEGLAVAVCNGSYDVAAFLLMETRSEFHSSFLPHGMSLSPVASIIFDSDNNVDYYSILGMFFTSVSECPNERCPFSAQWLTHKWTELQVELLKRKLGLRENGSFAASNPWKIPVLCGTESLDVLLTVDWESFSESIATTGSPYISKDNPTQIPLWVEALVFSPAVVGQISHDSSSTTQAFTNPASHNLADIFSTSGSFPPTSVVLSCVEWPTEPTAFVTPDGQGLLTLSYSQDERVFVFPVLERTVDVSMETQSFLNSDSGVHESSDMFETREPYHPRSDISSRDLQMLATDFIKNIKKPSCVKYVELSEAVCSLEDSEEFTVLLSAIRIVLHDCAEVVTLAQNQRVFWTELHNSLGLSTAKMYKENAKFPTCSKSLFKELVIKVDILSVPQDSLIQASLQSDALTIDVSLSTDSEHTSELPSFDHLLKKVIGSLAEAELAATKRDVEKMISARLIPRLQKSLKGVIDSDSISILSQSEMGDTFNLTRSYGELDPSMPLVEHLLQLKVILKQTNFLLHFADMFKVLSHKPRLLSSMRNFFSSGLKIIVNESTSTAFSVKAGRPHLTLNPSDFRQKIRNDNEILLNLFSSIFSTKTPLPDSIATIPAPFAAHIDMEKSIRFFHPLRGSKSILAVQLVGYNGQKLSSAPTVNCHVTATVKSPDNKVYTTVYSEDPSPHAVSRNLLITLKKNGTFEIEWTPNCEGMHTVSIAINKTPIRNSPFRVIVPGMSKNTRGASTVNSGGLRQCVAGTPQVDGSTLTVIASHPPYSCNHSIMSQPKVILPERPSIRCSAVMPAGNASPESKGSDSRVDTSVSHGASSVQDLEALAGKSPLHHISARLAAGSVGPWKTFSSGPVTIFIAACKYSVDEEATRKSSEYVGHFMTDCIPLANGLYRITLNTVRAATYKVCVACTVCQAVLKTHWTDSSSFLPATCYVLPGSFSMVNSFLSYRPTGRRKRARRGQALLTFSAESQATFYLHSFDGYGNAHTSGGAVKSVSVSSAGPWHTAPCFTANGTIPERRSQAAQCNTEYVSDGVYKLQCTVYAAGTHMVEVRDQFGNVTDVGMIKVESGPPSIRNCLLEPSIPKNASVSKRYQCLLYLYDEVFNPCSGDFSRSISAALGSNQMQVREISKTRDLSDIPHHKRRPNCVVLSCVPSTPGKQDLVVHINHNLVPGCPIQVNVTYPITNFKERIKVLKAYLRAHHCSGYTPTITIDRSNILESAINKLYEGYFHHVIRVRFGSESGIDTGGVSREFFHLLTQEFVNPQYALFHCVNGLFRPRHNSSVNPNHLFFFTFFGKILAKAICDGHQISVRFTPAVYKFLLQQSCTLDDLKIEDGSLHTGLLEILNSETAEELEHIAVNFTASQSHFGSLETVELVKGGELKEVTIQNKEEYVNKLFKWHLTGCIEEQLRSMKNGFNSLIPAEHVGYFSPHELEVILSGQPVIDISFIRERTVLSGYQTNSPLVMWFWEILESYSEEEKCEFLQFVTGCACLPSAITGPWEMHIKYTSNPSHLPVASTCVNSLTLPQYSSKAILKQKLKTAIDYGKQAFLLH